MRRIAIWMAASLVCAAVGAAPALAQTHAGIRAGVSADPDQFFFGGHIETKPLIEHLTFRPNVEVGIGDDLTLVGINLEFAYWLPIQGKPWRVYLGAGPAAVITSAHDDKPDRDNTGAGGGFNILVGAQHNKGLFGELKVGFGDSPGLKVTVGYAFR